MGNILPRQRRACHRQVEVVADVVGWRTGRVSGDDRRTRAGHGRGRPAEIGGAGHRQAPAAQVVVVPATGFAGEDHFQPPRLDRHGDGALPGRAGRRPGQRHTPGRRKYPAVARTGHPGPHLRRAGQRSQVRLVAERGGRAGRHGAGNRFDAPQPGLPVVFVVIVPVRAGRIVKDKRHPFGRRRGYNKRVFPQLFRRIPGHGSIRKSIGKGILAEVDMHRIRGRQRPTVGAVEDRGRLAAPRKRGRDPHGPAVGEGFGVEHQPVAADAPHLPRFAGHVAGNVVVAGGRVGQQGFAHGRTIKIGPAAAGDQVAHAADRNGPLVVVAVAAQDQVRLVHDKQRAPVGLALQPTFALALGIRRPVQHRNDPDDVRVVGGRLQFARQPVRLDRGGFLRAQADEPDAADRVRIEAHSQRRLRQSEQAMVKPARRIGNRGVVGIVMIARNRHENGPCQFVGTDGKEIVPSAEARPAVGLVGHVAHL